MTEVCPSAPVVVVALLTLPPPSRVQATSTPGIGLPNASATWTTSGLASVVPTGPLWSMPLTAVMPLAFSETALSVKGAVAVALTLTAERTNLARLRAGPRAQHHLRCGHSAGVRCGGVRAERRRRARDR